MLKVAMIDQQDFTTFFARQLKVAHYSVMIMHTREQQLQYWAEQQLALSDVRLQAVSGDASY